MSSTVALSDVVLHGDGLGHRFPHIHHPAVRNTGHHTKSASFKKLSSASLPIFKDLMDMLVRTNGLGAESHTLNRELGVHSWFCSFLESKIKHIDRLALGGSGERTK